MTIQLRDKTTIPQLGLGTWQLTGDDCVQSVATAIDLGYRHIDTAFAYDNHTEVARGIARAIAQSGIARDDLYITTKIPLGKQRRSQVIELGAKLQQELATDHVDLLLIHWPNKDVAFAETLEALAELVKRGVTRSIGISNFNASLVAEADSVSTVPIVTNQVEFHPLLFQTELLDACAARDIRITAYSPLGRGEVLTNPDIVDIATDHDAHPAQVAIAWLLRKGIVVIPKATGREHLKSNLDAANLSLTDDEIARIDAIKEKRRLVDGPWKHYPLE
ncbi:MAG: aldo/keto reductase [Spirochaetaceae bacterium]|nr:MAG: aldo/keto reductase [Spirochaetaceae bacterium]